MLMTSKTQVEVHALHEEGKSSTYPYRWLLRVALDIDRGNLFGKETRLDQGVSVLLSRSHLDLIPIAYC